MRVEGPAGFAYTGRVDPLTAFEELSHARYRRCLPDA